MAFDSREYEFADLTIVFGGKDIVTLRSWKHSAKQDKEPVHGKGANPRKIQKGNKTYEGELGLLQSDYETLVANSPNEDILDGQWNAIESYGNPSNGDVIITRKLIGIQFTEDTTEWKQGDKFQEKKLPFIFLRREKMPN